MLLHRGIIMTNTTVTFRTNDVLKREATKVFEGLGMNLSVAINLFMKQAVLSQKFPCSLELDVSKNIEATYPKDFFTLFGSGKNLGLDKEPQEIPFDSNEELLNL